MSDLFQPYLDTSAKQNRVSTYYARRVIDTVDIPAQTGETVYINNDISRRKVWLVLILMGLGGLALIGRAFFLQVVHGSEYRELADGNRIRLQYESASRGIIFDRNREALVKNIPNLVVTVTPSELPLDPTERDTVLAQTANILEMPLSELHAKIEPHAAQYFHQPLELVDFLPYEKAMHIAARLNRLPGVDLEVQAAREYVDPEIFSHVLGYLGKVTPDDLEQLDTEDEYILTDRLGKNGLEATYENTLNGTKGKRQVEVNALGQEIEVVAEEKPIAGSNLQLAIDADLQRTLYKALGAISSLRNSPGGAAVALDPRTGRVLALVSYPGFDSNAFTTGIDTEAYGQLLADERKPLFNKSVLGEYPSGSTFKLVVAAAALQEGVITPDSTVTSTGGVKVNQWFFPDWKSGGHGITDVRKALAESVNTFFYLTGGGTYNEETLEIEGGLGIDRINAYAKKFGLNQTSGVDLPSEASGFLPTKEWKERVKGETWYIGDTYNTAIGQGDVLVTPLQVALYTSVVANGGTLYEPSLVAEVQNQDGSVAYAVGSAVRLQNMVNSYYLQVVREGMRQAVISGSAKALQNVPVPVAAKTGTAQMANSDRTHSWLTAFAPYNDPQIVITVLVEEGGEGTEAALPVARQALQAYFTSQE